MEKLIEYLNSLDATQRTAFVLACETSENYLRKGASLGQKFGAELCVRIERASEGNVTRKDLHPDDWALIWPELDVGSHSRRQTDRYPEAAG